LCTVRVRLTASSSGCFKSLQMWIVIIFGHSHVPTLSRHGDVALFNPGALRNPSTGVRTAGIIELGEEGISFKHIPIR
jgi:predicted phosphodiesterase